MASKIVLCVDIQNMEECRMPYERFSWTRPANDNHYFYLYPIGHNSVPLPHFSAKRLATKTLAGQILPSNNTHCEKEAYVVGLLSSFEFPQKTDFRKDLSSVLFSK